MATYDIEGTRPCKICNECQEGHHRVQEGLIYHVLKDGHKSINMCVDCLREKGLIW